MTTLWRISMRKHHNIYFWRVNIKRVRVAQVTILGDAGDNETNINCNRCVSRRARENLQRPIIDGKKLESKHSCGKFTMITVDRIN